MNQKITVALAIVVCLMLMAACTPSGVDPRPTAGVIATETILPPTDVAPTATLVAAATESPSPTSQPAATNVPVPSADVTAAPQKDAPVVIFERSGGFVGDVTIWRLFDDGTVEISRDAGNAEDNVETFMVDHAEVQALLESLNQRNFFELDGNFLPKDPCCDRFNFVLTATRNGQEQRIETVEGTDNVPSQVWESIELVESFFARNPTQ